MSITLIRGDDQTIFTTIFTSPSKKERMLLINADEIWFSVKKLSNQYDVNDGNVLVQKTMSSGDIVITGAAVGEVEIHIDQGDLDEAQGRAKYKYDIQIRFIGNKIRTAIVDACKIEFDVTTTT